MVPHARRHRTQSLGDTHAHAQHPEPCLLVTSAMAVPPLAAVLALCAARALLSRHRESGMMKRSRQAAGKGRDGVWEGDAGRTWMQTQAQGFSHTICTSTSEQLIIWNVAHGQA